MIHVHPPPFTQFVSLQGSGKQPKLLQATAYAGFGRSLYFHRPLAPEIYEAELWLTALFLPVFPLAIWVIRPRGMRIEETSGIAWEIYESEFLGSQPLTPPRFLAMLGRALARTAAVLGPLMMSYLYVFRADGGRPSGLKFVLFLGSLVWAAALLFRWGLRRDKVYKGIE